MDMRLVMTDNKSVFLEQLNVLIEAKLKKALRQPVQVLADAFFDQYPLADLKGRSLDDIYGLVYEAYEFIQTLSKRPSITVINPTIKADH